MKKFHSSKLIAGAAIFLGIAGITGSALAAYIITGGTKTGSDSITPTEIKVNNKVANLSVAKNDDVLEFEPTKAETKEGDRISANGSGDLTCSFDLSIVTETKANIGDISLVITTEKVTSEGQDIASFGTYIAIPNIGAIKNTSFDNGTDAGNGNKTFKFTQSVSFTWGTAFNSKDPVDYYNNDATGKTVSLTDVQSQMETFKNVINNTKLVFTFTMADAA